MRCPECKSYDCEGNKLLVEEGAMGEEYGQ